MLINDEYTFSLLNKIVRIILANLNTDYKVCLSQVS